MGLRRIPIDAEDLVIVTSHRDAMAKKKKKKKKKKNGSDLVQHVVTMCYPATLLDIHSTSYVVSKCWH
jgi:hypothetical protein